MRISRTVEVRQSPRSVWATLEDFDQWSKWATPLGTPRRQTQGRWQLGWRSKVGGTSFEITDLTDLGPGHQMIWFGSSFGKTSIWTFLVEPVRGRTEMTLIIEENGWWSSLAGRFTRKRQEANLRAAMDNFKKHADASPAVPRIRQETT